MTKPDDKDPYKAPRHIQPTSIRAWVSLTIWLQQRLNRIYFLFYVLSIGLTWLLILIGCGYLARMVGTTWAFIPVGVLLFSSTALIFLFIALLIKRLHDINLNAWLSIICLIPPLILLVFIWPGSKGHNRFGETPKAPPATLSFVVLVTTLSLLLIAISQALLIFSQSN